jgi:multiple sugar transport system substrate-binding protein
MKGREKPMSNRKLSALLQDLNRGTITRREFMGRALALGISLSALGSLLQVPARAQSQADMQWWDQFGPLVPLHQQLWDAFSSENPGVSVDYTQLNPAEMGQALQLAYRSNQAPDVHTLVGLGVPPSQLIAEGWLAPLADGFDTSSPFLREALVEGQTIFGGRLYSFPIFSFRQHETSLWYHKEMIERAGLDPELGPQTWDEVRQAARAVTEKGDGRVFGLLLPLQFTGRMAAHVGDLAEIAGLPGLAGQNGSFNWHSGEYADAADEFVQAIEFLLSFQQDRSLHPASSSLDARQGRARWVAGEAAMFFDGPWNSGVLNNSFAEAIDGIGVARIPAPTASRGTFTYNPPPAGTFWLSSQAEDPELVTELLQSFTTDEYYEGLARRMDQPPLDLSAVERAEVHSTYRTVIAAFQEDVRLSPSPAVRNPDTSKVNAETRAVSPSLGEIVQGAFSGAIRSLPATLRQYADRLTAERERALGVVQATGAQVSVDDWVFADWQPGEDYTAEKYQ